MIEARVARLVGLAESQGYGFLAYLLNMAQLEAKKLASQERGDLSRGTGSHG